MRTHKKTAFWVILLIASIVGAFFSGLLDTTPTIEIGGKYTLYFSDSRPSIDDPEIMACIPAAYTGDNGIIGHYSIGKGRKGLSDYRYTTINLDNNTCFQQATLVKNGYPKTFSDKKHRFRRALCKKGNRYYIEHSKIPVTLDTFAKHLLNYDMAWNLDMGTYSYGWYKDENGVVHHLGLSSYWNKGKQSNWIIIRRKYS